MSPGDYKAHRITAQDDVAVVAGPVPAGQKVMIEDEYGQLEVTAQTDIPSGHKIALRDLAAGQEVIKYGQCIGGAICDIKTGEHVHVHNLEGLRGRGDKQA